VAVDAIGKFSLTAGDYDNEGDARYTVPEFAKIPLIPS